LEGFAIEDVGISYGRFVYFAAFWYILWPFGIVYGYFSSFGMLYLATLFQTPGQD
jgi:hypothetical protein